MSQRRHEGGFILPLSILLVIILAISGMGFMQLDVLKCVRAAG